MTNPNTPPPELRCQWQSESPFKVISVEREDYMIDRASQWQLEACCEWLANARNHDFGYDYGKILSDRLRAAMSPKPLSLKEKLSKAIIEGDERGALKLLEELDD